MIVAFGIALKSTTRSDDAAARTARAFWSSVAQPCTTDPQPADTKEP